MALILNLCYKKFRIMTILKKPFKVKSHLSIHE